MNDEYYDQDFHEEIDDNRFWDDREVLTDSEFEETLTYEQEIWETIGRT